MSSGGLRALERIVSGQTAFLKAFAELGTVTGRVSGAASAGTPSITGSRTTSSSLVSSTRRGRPQPI